MTNIIYGKPETQEKPQASQGLILVGDKFEEFKKMALEVVEGNKIVAEELRRKENEKEKTKFEDFLLYLGEHMKINVKGLECVEEKTLEDYKISIDDVINNGDENRKLDFLNSCLLHCLRNGTETKLIEEMIFYGADVNCAKYGSDGKPTYFITGFNGSLDNFKILLEKGSIDFTLKDNNGENFLITTIKGMHRLRIIMIEDLSQKYQIILLEAMTRMSKEEINHKDNAGMSAYMYAKKYKLKEIIKLFEELKFKLNLKDKIFLKTRGLIIK